MASLPHIGEPTRPITPPHVHCTFGNSNTKNNRHRSEREGSLTKSDAVFWVLAKRLATSSESVLQNIRSDVDLIIITANGIRQRTRSKPFSNDSLCDTHQPWYNHSSRHHLPHDDGMRTRTPVRFGTATQKSPATNARPSCVEPPRHPLCPCPYPHPDPRFCHLFPGSNGTITARSLQVARLLFGTNRRKIYYPVLIPPLPCSVPPLVRCSTPINSDLIPGRHHQTFLHECDPHENSPGNSPIRCTANVSSTASMNVPPVVEKTMTEKALCSSSWGLDTFIPKNEPTKDASVTHSDMMLKIMLMYSSRFRIASDLRPVYASVDVIWTSRRARELFSVLARWRYDSNMYSGSSDSSSRISCGTGCM
mmetsp:Transcript_8378/g.22673  ORF Transcript_8378/g.22673 Transcript_8378/m.22673 type:complete len:365 (+) Transcript_8378:52-1146(+)